MTPSTALSLTVLQRAFPGILLHEAGNLASEGVVRAYPPGTVLCHEDAYETTFYIILDGEVDVTKVIENEQVRLLKHLCTGDFFGEMALVHEAPRAATVTTTAPTTVLEIEKERFDRLLRTSATMTLAIVREVSRRLRENDTMAIEDLRLKAGELATAYQRLAEQDYARREFLTTIAHELRTPLTAANGYLQMIRSGQIEGQALEPALDSVNRNVQQIVSLVNDILFLQEMDLIFVRSQTVDLKAAVRGAIEKHQEEARESGVRICVETAQDLPEVQGDARTLERALSAVIHNAIKFSPNGGEVWVQAMPAARQAVIRVRDSGVGIPADALPHIFERFFHLDQVGEHLFRGAGLGLSIARHVVEQHQGEIQVESREGAGCTVTIRLPAS